MATQFAHDFRAARSAEGPAARRHLIGPVADFFCFGGSALIILPLLLLLPVDAWEQRVAAVMLLVAHLVNYPHFAHSYQLFYRGFRAKTAGGILSPAMRARYLFAGIGVPLLLAAFFALCFSRNDIRLLGYSANAMALFVGWHYVKQGYGLLMVDCTLKRQFFDGGEKRVLLLNSYAVWAASWAAANVALAHESLWGIGYYTFALPRWLVVGLAALASGTSGMTAWMLFSRWRAHKALPVNGVIAYVASLYLWQAFVLINPLWFLVSPALHSLQYLAVVWRFQANYERAGAAAPESDGKPSRGFAMPRVVLFSLTGIALGFAGFWLIPAMGDTLVPYDKALFGGTALLFTGWIFINIHHYFIDNVIWRRDNPDAKAHLFG